MIKPQQLRAELTRCLPWLTHNPGNLKMLVGNASVAATLATSLTHEYRYTLSLLFLD